MHILLMTTHSVHVVSLRACDLLETVTLASTPHDTCHQGLCYLATHKCTLHRNTGICCVVWDKVLNTEKLSRLTEKPLFRDINHLCSSCHRTNAYPCLPHRGTDLGSDKKNQLRSLDARLPLKTPTEKLKYAFRLSPGSVCLVKRG